MEKLELVYKALEDIKADQKEIKYDLKDISVEVKKNTYDLEYHIKRTDINEQRLKVMEERLSLKYLLKLTMGTAAGIGTIAGAIYSLVKVISYFN